MATILLVDDDEDIREALASLLQDEGYQVACAANGRDALDWLAGRDVFPKIILLDWMMPVMDGEAFLIALEQTPAIAALPVLVISAAGKARLTNLRGRRVLPKPLDVPTLLAALEEACGTSSA